MLKVQRGVAARKKRALTCAAVAGIAGLSMGGAAWADDTAADAAVATADQGAGTVSGITVEGQRQGLDNVKVTAEPLNNPQTVTVVSRGVIEAQNLLSLRDILSTVPGITFGAGEGGGGFGDSINLRGYSANNDITVDGVRDSAQYSRSDPFNIEQIEITNGANGVYSGSGSVGGTINIVSKRPSMRDFTVVTGGVGTDGYLRGTVDANHKVSDGTAVRINAMAHKNDAPGRDVEKFERWGVAPSITLGMDGPTQFTAMWFHQEDENVPQYGVPFFNGRPLPGVDPANYYGYENVDTQEQTVDMLTGIIDHEFSATLKIRNLTRWQKVTQFLVVDAPQGTWCLSNGLKPVAWSQSTTATNLTGYAPCVAGDPPPGFYQPSGNPRGNLRDTENTLLHNQTDLTWLFDVGSTRHTLVAGAAFFAEDFHLDTGNVLRNANGAAVALPPMSIADPLHRYVGPINYIRASIQEGARQNQAVYLFDNVEFGDRWSLNFGLRYEHNEGENRTDTYSTATATLGQVTPGPTFRSDENLFTYRVGLVFKPIPEASLYVAYASSQTPSQATVNGSGACNAATCNVDPEEAENFEIGGKWDIAGRLSLTAALFRNDRTNYRVPSGDPQVTFQLLDGSARVQGVALGASGRITDAWAVFANYTYLDSEVLQGASSLLAAQGQDFTKGDPLTNVPDHAFSLFTTYDLPNKIQLGYSVTYQGEYYLTQHAAVTGSNPPVRTTIPLVKAESYIVHRVTVAWTPTENVELRLNVNNLLDEEYYTRGRNNGWATPGDTRNATLTASYRF